MDRYRASKKDHTVIVIGGFRYCTGREVGDFRVTMDEGEMRQMSEKRLAFITDEREEVPLQHKTAKDP
jgi:hypothetical protein